MPGFFERLGRMIKGEPVFKADEQHDTYRESEEKAAGWGDDNPDASRADRPVVPPVKHAGPKICPQVVIERTECHTSGSSMRLDVTIQNNHSAPLFLDKIILFGNKRELDVTLRPAQEREFTVYNGARLTDRYQTKCELWYRDESGDYFSALHNVEFEQESDKTYTVKRMRFVPPVKDI